MVVPLVIAGGVAARVAAGVAIRAGVRVGARAIARRSATTAGRQAARRGARGLAAGAAGRATVRTLVTRGYTRGVMRHRARYPVRFFDDLERAGRFSRSRQAQRELWRLDNKENALRRSHFPELKAASTKYLGRSVGRSIAREQNAAAGTIQRYGRGYIYRKSVKEDKAARTLQRYGRGFFYRRLVNEARPLMMKPRRNDASDNVRDAYNRRLFYEQLRHRQAAKIQGLGRGYLQRKGYYNRFGPLAPQYKYGPTPYQRWGMSFKEFYKHYRKAQGLDGPGSSHIRPPPFNPAYRPPAPFKPSQYSGNTRMDYAMHGGAAALDAAALYGLYRMSRGTGRGGDGGHGGSAAHVNFARGGGRKRSRAMYANDKIVWADEKRKRIKYI